MTPPGAGQRCWRVLIDISLPSTTPQRRPARGHGACRLGVWERRRCASVASTDAIGPPPSWSCTTSGMAARRRRPLMGVMLPRRIIACCVLVALWGCSAATRSTQNRGRRRQPVLAAVRALEDAIVTLRNFISRAHARARERARCGRRAAGAEARPLPLAPQRRRSVTAVRLPDGWRQTQLAPLGGKIVNGNPQGGRFFAG